MEDHNSLSLSIPSLINNIYLVCGTSFKNSNTSRSKCNEVFIFITNQIVIRYTFEFVMGGYRLFPGKHIYYEDGYENCD